MLNIIAGEKVDSYVDLVFDLGSAPGHVSVLRDWDRDEETYAEPELSDLELLALAAEDAMDAVSRNELLGAGALDSLSLRRVRRQRRRAVAEVLRTEEAIA